MEKIDSKKVGNTELLIYKNNNGRLESYISMPTTQTNRKVSRYSKFYYINCWEDNKDGKVSYREQINFIMDNLSKEDVINLFNFITESLKKPEVKSLKDCIKLIMKTFGRVLGLTYEKIVGLAGELLLIEYLFNNDIDISPFFHERDEMLYDFYIEKSNSYIEVKSTVSNSEVYSMKLNQLTKNSKKTSFVTVKFQEDSNGLKLIEIMDRILENKNLDFDFLTKLQSLREAVEIDLIAPEHSFDTKNIEFKFYPPEIIQNNISILSVLSENSNWDHIEKITLDLNLTGIASKEVKLIKEFI